MIANDINGDKAVIRSGLWIRGNNDFCTVTAINRRVTVFGNTATIEFRNTGTPTGFRCRLDQQQYLPCEFNCHPTTYYIIMKQSHNYLLNFDVHEIIQLYAYKPHTALCLGSSPVILRNLDPGNHQIRIRPVGCGRAGIGHRSISIYFEV